MDRITHEMRLANWKKVLEECQSRPEGMSAKQWLIENHVSETQYYYWQRRFRKEAYNQMKAELAVTGGEQPAVFTGIPVQHITSPTGQDAEFHADAVIKTGRMTIALSNTVSDALLMRLMEVVRHAG